MAGWEYIGSPSSTPTVNQIKQAIINYGPVSVAVYVNASFSAYSGGVFTVSEDRQVNHGVVLVGWDDTQGRNGVWILRNSWGTGWGEAGYMRIEYGCSRVGYGACYVVYPRNVPPERQSMYTVTEVPGFYGERINDSGHIVGSVGSAQGDRPAVWRAVDQTQELGTLGGSHGVGRDINIAGQIAGYADTTEWTEIYWGEDHAFLWLPVQAWNLSTGINDLGTLGGIYSYAYGINNLGQVVGHSTTSYEDLHFPFHAFLWTPGASDGVNGNPQMKDLGTLGDSSAHSAAEAINDRGQVVGMSWISETETFPMVAFLWLPEPDYGLSAGMHDLGTLEGDYSHAEDINNSGWVVGASSTAPQSGGDSTRAFVWIPGGTGGPPHNPQMRLLGSLWEECPFQIERAYAINDHGQIVGYSRIDTGTNPQKTHAFIWQNDKMQDLNHLIPVDCKWELIRAVDISDRGQILCVGEADGEYLRGGILLNPTEGVTAGDVEPYGSRILTTDRASTAVDFTSNTSNSSSVTIWGYDGSTGATGSWVLLSPRLRINTALADGNCRTVARIGYDHDPNSTFTECVLDLLSSDETTGQYQLAVAANTTGEATRYISHISGEYAPGVTDGSQMALGSYGVNTADDFVWAVVDYAGDFSTGYRREIDNVVFADPVNYVAGSWPYDIVTADLDRDGDVDIAIANTGVVSTGYWDGSLSVLLNNGDGTYGTPTNYVAGHAPVCVAAGDVNGDSFTDLAIANVHGNNISLFINNRDGTFPDPVTYSVGSNPQGIGFGDIDNDGDADMVVANRSLGSSKGTIWILSNDGNGTFSHDQSYTVGREPISLVVTDLNGDGYLDVAVANYGGSVSVLKNQGNGALGDLRTYAVSGGPWTIKAAPIDQDDAFDLVVACYNGHRLEILRNLGNGEFESASQYDVPTVSEGLVLQDLDFDGDFDIVAANNNTPGMSLFLNQGDGTFICSPSALGGGSQIACDDLNRDGLYDLIFSRSRQNVVSVLMNLSEINASVDPDFNDDGVVNSLDMAILASQWLDGDCANETDLTCDGRVEFDDVLLFARHWLDQIQ